MIAYARVCTLVTELHLPAEFYNSIIEGETVELAAACMTREPIVDSAGRTFRCVSI